MPLSEQATSPNLHVFTRKLPEPVFWIFTEASFHKHDWLSHLPLVLELNLQPSLFTGQGVGLKAPNPLILWFLPPIKDSPHTSREPHPILRCGPKSLTKHKQHFYCSYHAVNSKGLEGNGTPLQYPCLENPKDGGAWWAADYGVAQSRTRLSNFTSLSTFMHWRRKWQPTPVFLPGESQGRGSLVGCRLWGRTESDTTEVT